MSIKKHIPTVATSMGAVCPVCGRRSYSLGGVHPQCSQFREDQQLWELHKRDEAALASMEQKT